MKKFISGALLTAVLMASGSAVAAPAAHVRNVATEEANRQLVVDFYDKFFNRHEVKEAAKVVDEHYRQHNPDVPDGKAPFVNYFTGFFKENPHSAARIVRSAADGDLVWLQVHSTNDSKDRGQAVMDIFRVSNGKIVEHWDIIQSVPEKSANANTMF